MTDLTRKRELTKLRVRKYRERLKRGLDPIPNVTVPKVQPTALQPDIGYKPHLMMIGSRWMWI
jgi:hypothetical protein